MSEAVATARSDRTLVGWLIGCVNRCSGIYSGPHTMEATPHRQSSKLGLAATALHFCLWAELVPGAERENGEG